MTHGRITLTAANCTSCMICVRECPAWCIHLDSHTEQATEEGARRPRSVSVLDTFEIDWGLCMYCGICVEVCPFDALHWAADSVPAATDAAGLRHGIAALAPGSSPDLSGS